MIAQTVLALGGTALIVTTIFDLVPTAWQTWNVIVGLLAIGLATVIAK